MTDRLTFYDEGNNPCYRTMLYSPFYEKTVESVVSNSDVARKLAHYEELAEQGRLIITPPKKQVDANIKSLRWIMAHIPDEGNNTFGHAVHLYINNAISIIEGTGNENSES